MQYKKLLAETLQKMKDYSRWRILIHENPDGDTLGCGLAIYSMGRRMSKETRIMGKSSLPGSYGFLPFSENYEWVQMLDAATSEGALIICVDTSTAERSVDGFHLFAHKDNSINIDHHGDNKMYAGLNLVIPEASATAEIVMDIFELNGLPVERSEAACLYTALVTDNGNFRFKSTTPHSHRCAAKLLETGIDPSELDDLINKNMTEGIMRLWGDAFCRVETFAGGKAVISWLDQSDFMRAGADYSAADGLVNLLMRIKGADIALLVTEFEGAAKVSVRTRDYYSARQIAAAWGGGGHTQAAGAKIDALVEDAVKIVRDRVAIYVIDRDTAAR